MPPTLAELGIDRLSVSDRIALAQAIWDSLPPGAGLTEAKRQELESRLVDHLTEPNNVVPWEEIKAAALARWRS